MNNESLQPEQNTGVIIQEPRPSDFMAGAESGLGFEVRVKGGNWTKFLPLRERQKFTWETNSCVTFSDLNTIETGINWLIANNKISALNMKRLKNEGFIVDGQINLSDRFTAYMSKTTKAGNNLQAVVDSVKNDGACPQATWDYTQEQGAKHKTWDSFWKDYYQDPTAEAKVKALVFKSIFDIGYEWVFITGSPLFDDVKKSLKKHLEHAPIQIITKVGKNWNGSDTVKNPGCGTGHGTMAYRQEDLTYILDHYNPFEKTLAADYCIPYAMKITVNEKTTPVAPPKPVCTINKPLKFGMRDPQVKNLQDVLKYLGFFTFKETTDYYGWWTQQAVYEFQKAKKIPTPWGDWAQNPERQVGTLTIFELKKSLM